MTRNDVFSTDPAKQPRAVVSDVARLRASLDTAVPGKTAFNLLIGTWNVRALGGVTEKWESGKDGSPKRDWHAAACIAEILTRFDVVAVQEVRRDPGGLRRILQFLGPDFRAISSDATEGGPGNGERLGFVYDTRRVQASGLVGEIVLPAGVAGPALQFARTPYVASFTRGTVEFILATVHIIWGNDTPARVKELADFAQWMRSWNDRQSDWNGNLLVLGDFNIDRLGDKMYEALVSTGLFPPTELFNLPRTVFDDPKGEHFYDQIAWFSEPTGASLLRAMTYTNRAGSFNFVPEVLNGLTVTQKSWRISDHYPLWVEFQV